MAGSKTYQDLLPETTDTDSELLFEMANLSPKRTGLPFVVWISPRGNARHDVRVKVSPGPRAVPSGMVSVAIRPDVHVVEGEMKAGDLTLLGKWVSLNRDVLIRYWEGDIEFTEEAMELLQPI
ncbi:MAG: DUF4160 domain-containing protein [Acidobacteriaceae bacterium]|nr:DUF4160 domain-containing protein [Acidobacteriaceae bacterium]MBV9226947.1 DUF4160 domain-containing protein [Acidobacteriaceae bacterium]MBV9307150.1 DUF4160 domain-containing protein [Acidobacteriaceae bacterium]